MPRYETMFSRLAASHEGAFVPFLILGDPAADICLDAVDALVAAGADALELGIPFSDAVADGPVIQSAAARALASGTTPEKCFAMVTRIRERHPGLPIGLLVYANLVVHAGADRFLASASRAGVDSILVADLPGTEIREFALMARTRGIAPVMIAPPDASGECLSRIAAFGGGYTYVLGRVGVTGAEQAMRAPALQLVAKLHAAHAPPPLVGFGLSEPIHMRTAIASGAAGGIVGSALVRCLRENGIAAMAALAGTLKAATRAA